MNKLDKESGSPCLTIYGTPNHVHALCSPGRTTTVADLVEVLKKRSSKWIKTKGRKYQNFQWQIGFGGRLHESCNIPRINRNGIDAIINRHSNRFSLMNQLRQYCRFRKALDGLVFVPLELHCALNELRQYY
jgi:REP element-mobilizing transposase RayT